MAEILRYVLVDESDVEGDYEYEKFDDAVKDAAKYGKAVVQRTYTYDDQELVWTPDGSDVWPPSADAGADEE